MSMKPGKQGKESLIHLILPFNSEHGKQPIHRVLPPGPGGSVISVNKSERMKKA